MSDWFSTAVEMQREILRAQKTQLEATEQQLKMAERMIEAGKQVTAMQEVGQQAAEANLKAWKEWAKFWGWK